MSTYEEIEARLKAKAEEPSPESIKFERPGQSVIGRVRRYEKGSTDWGDCVICVIESLTTGNLASIWIFGTVLANAFQKQQPRPGEIIRVEFKGIVQREGQSDYKDWTLTVDRPHGDGLTYAEAAGVAAAASPPPAPVEPEQHFPTTGDFHDAEPAPAAAPAAPADDTDDIPF